MKTRRTLTSVVLALSILAQTAESVFADGEDPMTLTPTPTEEVMPQDTEVQIDPALTVTDVATSTPIPEATPTPEVQKTEVVFEEPSVPPPGCTIQASVNSEGWVEATVQYWGGPQGPGLWWVLRVRPAGREFQEWTGWENLSDGERSQAELFAPEVDLRVDFLGIQENVCEGSFSAPPPAPTPTPTPSPENTHQESSDQVSYPKPQLMQTLGTLSPNQQLEVIGQNGQLGVRDASGQIVFIDGALGENPLWLADWTILAKHADGSLFLTDRLATFTRELGVSGEVVSISGDGEWLKITGNTGLTIVSIHGMRYGLGDADSPVFAQIAFPGT